MMIRPAQSEEAVAIREIAHDAYRHYVARLGKLPGPMLDDYGRRIAEGQAWVLEVGGALAGVLVLENVEDGTLLLDNVAVAPAEQRKGYGRALVTFAEAEARRRGHAQLRLYTHVLMTENIALYRGMGFEETGRITEQGYERVYMSKRVR